MCAQASSSRTDLHSPRSTERARALPPRCATVYIVKGLRPLHASCRIHAVRISRDSREPIRPYPRSVIISKPFTLVRAGCRSKAGIKVAIHFSIFQPPYFYISCLCA